MTLYKNEKSTLPLSDTKDKKVALIGPQGTNAGTCSRMDIRLLLHDQIVSLKLPELRLMCTRAVAGGCACFIVGLLFGNYAGSANGGNWGMSIAQGLTARLAKAGGTRMSIPHSSVNMSIV
jgi:hypothetical protein